jgi:hypothetical protein
MKDTEKKIDITIIICFILYMRAIYFFNFFKRKFIQDVKYNFLNYYRKIKIQ